MKKMNEMKKMKKSEKGIAILAIVATLAMIVGMVHFSPMDEKSAAASAAERMVRNDLSFSTENRQTMEILVGGKLCFADERGVSCPE